MAGQVKITGGSPGANKILTSDANGLARWQEVPSSASGPLAYVVYNPPTDAVYSTLSTSFIDVNATNLAVTFVAPASGKVLVRLTALTGIGGGDVGYWNLREGTSNLAETASYMVVNSIERASQAVVVTGLTPGSSHTYKWGFRVRVGGLVDRTLYIYAGSADPMFGPAVMEVWALP